MKPATTLRQRLSARRLTLGILITNHLWLELIEIAIDVGLDYVIVDLEHIGHGDERVADACRLGRLAGFPVLVRPPRTDAESIRLAADLGPCGLLTPMIESAAQLDEIAKGLYMPPRGERRPGGHGNWWPADFNYESWKTQVEDHWIVLPQIESPRGIEQASAIASHPLTTALAVGPYDLSARLGVCYQPDHADLQGAFKRIRTAAEQAGKTMWMIGDSPTLIRQGYHFLCIAEPSNYLRAALGQYVRQLRSNDTAAPGDVKAFTP